MDCGKQKSINQTIIDDIRLMEEDLDYFIYQLKDINKQIKTKEFKTKKKLKQMYKLRKDNIKQIKRRREEIRIMQQKLLIC